MTAPEPVFRRSESTGRPHYHSRVIGYGDGMFMFEYPDGSSEPLPAATDEEASAKGFELLLAWEKRTENADRYLQTDVHGPEPSL